MTKNDDTRAAAITEVEKWQATYAHWVSEEITAIMERDDLKARMGGELLEDPTRVDKIADALQRADRAIEAAQSAIVAAEPRVLAAKHAVLEHDAASLDQEAGSIRRRLTAHDAKTAELLAALRAHEGEFVHARVMDAEVSKYSVQLVGSSYSLSSKSGDLQVEAEQLELKASLLRDVVSGADPNLRLNLHASSIDGSVLGVPRDELLPSTIWGPDALVSPDSWLARVEGKRAELEAFDTEMAAVTATGTLDEHHAAIAEIQHQIAEDLTAYGQIASVGQMREITARETEIRNLLTIAGAPARRASILAELEALTGDRQSVEV